MQISVFLFIKCLIEIVGWILAEPTPLERLILVGNKCTNLDNSTMCDKPNYFWNFRILPFCVGISISTTLLLGTGLEA